MKTVHRANRKTDSKVRLDSGKTVTVCYCICGSITCKWTFYANGDWDWN
jgi:hypothetical protein